MEFLLYEVSDGGDTQCQVANDPYGDVYFYFGEVYDGQARHLQKWCEKQGLSYKRYLIKLDPSTHTCGPWEESPE